MKKIITPLAIIVLGGAVITLAKPKFSSAPAAPEGPGAVAYPAAAAAARPDLSGTWALDVSRSDLPWMHRGAGNGAAWSGRPREGAYRAGQGGPRRRLPTLIQITQTASAVTFADSAGTALQQIDLGDKGGAPSAEGAIHRDGSWKDGALEATRQGRGGMAVVERWSLQDGGATLVWTTRFQGGELGDRTMKRVYRRVKES